MNSQDFGIVELSTRVYRRFLRLYPAEHRDEYGWLMSQLFRDKAYDALRREGHAGIILYNLAALLDLILSAIQERREKGFTVAFQF
jgi:hypothetical protein